MKTRTMVIIIGLALLATAAVGVGAAFAFRSPAGPYAYGPGMMRGYQGTPGAYGPGGMMGGYGPGGMMGGYYVPTATTGTPVVGVTQVDIQNFAFQPANIQVQPGTTVTWTNRDTAPHTVAFSNGSGMQGSAVLRQGDTFSYTFKTAGTFQYYCSVHPYMVGTVTVAG